MLVAPLLRRQLLSLYNAALVLLRFWAFPVFGFLHVWSLNLNDRTDQ